MCGDKRGIGFREEDKVNIIKEKVLIDYDLTFTSFFTSLQAFKEKFNLLPDTLKIGLDNLGVAKSILKHIEPQDYETIKDKIDLDFRFKLDEKSPDYYWEISKIVGDIEYILYSNGA